jgi:phosphoribosylanthranilate isomerase
VIIQIYAFTNIDQALQAAQWGVDHIGFIAGRKDLVHGELTLVEARHMADALQGQAQRVALTMETQVDEIVRMAESVAPDIIHVSTDPLAVGFDAMEALRKRLPSNTKIMKAIPVDDENSLELAVRFAPLSDYLLLDTKIHGLPGVGATGRTHDWKISRQVVEAVDIPVILAGGLSPENVAQAIRIVKPAGVDSNTATNLPGSPVEKDMERVRRFVEAVRLERTDKGSSLDKNGIR